MSIKLNGATNGSVELDVPAAIGSDLSVTIPATAGDIVVKGTDGSVDLGAIDIAASAPADSVNIDSSGRLLVGTSSAVGSSIASTALVQAQGRAGFPSDYSVINARAGYTPSGADAALGFLTFCDNNNNIGAWITAYSDGGGWTSGSNHRSRLMFSTTADGASSPTERMRISQNGALRVPAAYTLTTGNAANCSVQSDGTFQRSTSSIKYKTDVETLENEYADNLLNCRPVWYRSLSPSDNAQHSYWGFIAEEVAAIDPRLVHWKTVEITYDENGSAVETSCDPEPEGVQYDRFVPHLLNLIKRQKEQIETQGTAIAALEARLTALEGGNP
jgi:hypothetical protein